MTIDEKAFEDWYYEMWSHGETSPVHVAHKEGCRQAWLRALQYEAAKVADQPVELSPAVAWMASYSVGPKNQEDKLFLTEREARNYLIEIKENGWLRCYMFPLYFDRQPKRELSCTEKSVNWRPIETAPDNTHILVHYKNGCGKDRIVKARWIPKYTEENTEGEFCDYHEERDTYYDPEGWYEAIDNWPDYSHVAFCEGQPDFWMPLPAMPTADIEGGN